MKKLIFFTAILFCVLSCIPSAINAQIIVEMVDVSCIGDTDGKITVSVVMPGTFKYSLDAGEWQSIPTFDNLAPGDYTIEVLETETGCISETITATIEEPEELEVTIHNGGVKTYCKTRPTVILTAEITGGTPPYETSWDGFTREATHDGPYVITVTDSKTCDIVSAATEVRFVKEDCDDDDDDDGDDSDPDYDPKKKRRYIWIPVVVSGDPNEIKGPSGFEAAGWISVKDTMKYTIFYENDPELATAPAQVVYVTQPVDTNLTPFSFRLSDFGFGDYQFSVPSNSLFYTDRLDLRDAMGIFVDVTAGYDAKKRELFWRLASIDPKTGLTPADPEAGFLPVNDSLSGAGEGFLSYTIQPLHDLQTGDSISAKASIIFDVNDPIPTNTWQNKVDAVAPVSQMAPLPETIDTSRFIISWSGQDDPGGVGIGTYDLYVSENGAPFRLLFAGLDTTEMVFWGMAGNTYGFYTRARDNVGNQEGPKFMAETTITIEERPLITLDIPVYEGWNMISSYVEPTEPGMLSALSPLYDEVILLKDGVGDIVIPSLGINGIGDWTITEGYQLKVTTDTILRLSGLQVNPLQTPIPIVEGWQIIAYLRDSPSDIATELALIDEQIVLVKNYAGLTFIPAYGINDIGDMIPTQGYQMKSVTTATFFYRANSAAPKTAAQKPTLATPQHFVLATPFTGRNATLILPENIVGKLLSNGDEIGVFTQSGLLCGAVVYEERNTAMALWGDDAASSGLKEGLQEAEAFVVRFWDQDTQQEYLPDLELSTRAPIYQTDGIYIVEKAEKTVTNLEYPFSKALYFEYFPNPADEKVFFQLELSETADIRLDLLNAEGKYIANVAQGTYTAGWHGFDFDINSLSSGLYMVRLSVDDAYRMYKLTVVGR